MIRTIYEWADRAASYIRFKPDRPPVIRELTQHYLDHRDDLIRAGTDRQDAERAALESMGDPDETGKLLNRMHKPYLGWLWVISRWAVSLTAFVFLTGLFRFPVGEAIRHYYYGWPAFFGEEVVSRGNDLKALYDGKDRERELFRVYGTCSQTVRAGDYTVSVERSVWRRDWHGDSFQFILRAEADSLTLGSPEVIRDYLTATDSAGNYYVNLSTSLRTNEPLLGSNRVGRALRSWYYDFWLENMGPDIRWVDLHYDRYGISFVLRIDLTGDRV